MQASSLLMRRGFRAARSRVSLQAQASPRSSKLTITSKVETSTCVRLMNRARFANERVAALAVCRFDGLRHQFAPLVVASSLPVRTGPVGL